MQEIYDILKGVRPEFDFAGSEDFVEDGYLDSFDIISLVSKLEERYRIQIDGMDIVPENFCTVEAIAALIRKSNGRI